MIPVLYDENELNFTDMGICALADATSVKVRRVLNGQDELEMKYPVSSEFFKELKNLRIILSVPEYKKSVQAYRIYRVSKPMNGFVTVNARHISERRMFTTVAPFTASTVQEAISRIGTYVLDQSSPFTFYTDKTTVAPYSRNVPSSLGSILGGSDGSFLDVFGGEYEFDMYQVKLLSRRGIDRGVSVSYGKNLTNLEVIEAVDETVITSICPVWIGQDGEVVYLPEYIIDSQYVSAYPFKRVIVVDFSADFDEEPSVSELRAAGQDYLTKNQIGVPVLTLKISFVHLAQFEEYKQFAVLETLNLGDTVKIRHIDLDVDIAARIVETTFDVLNEKYTNVVIGRVQTNMSSTLQTIEKSVNKTVKETKNLLSEAIVNVTDKITGANGGYVIQNFDQNGVPFEILIMDTPDKMTATNVLRINQNGIGFSKTGYNGPFTTGWTIDGQFVADFITSGTMSANRIRTGLITDVSGNNYWNLDTGEFVNRAITQRMDNMQDQIDDNVQTWSGADVPTLNNYPAVNWTTTAQKDSHVGDLYIISSGQDEGTYYRFLKTGNVYEWKVMTDTEVQKALADAEEALRRISIAETQIEQNSEAIALRATKTEAQGYASTAQSNAATDATNKANAAVASANNATDQKLQNYSTTSQMEAAIELSASGIIQTVSATYETKNDATTKLNTAKTYAEGQAASAETNAKGYTDGALINYSTTTQMNSAISQSASAITQSVSATYETKAEAAVVNLLPSVYARENISGAVWTNNGITWTVNPDGSVIVTGTATADSFYYFSGETLSSAVPLTVLDPTKKHRLSGGPSGGSDSTFRYAVRRFDENMQEIGYLYAYSGEATIPAGCAYACVYAKMASGYSTPAGGLTFRPMLETGETTHGYVSTHGGTGAVARRVESAEAELVVQAGQISSKVSTTDYNGNTIASKINQNATTVQISASKINLQGAVTISSFDSTTKATLVTGTTTKMQYYLSTSSASATGGTWKDTTPTWSSGKYVWVRVATTKTYADSSSNTTYSTAVYDANLTSALSTASGASTAASAAQTTANGNIKSSVSCYYRYYDNGQEPTQKPTIDSSTTIYNESYDTDNRWSYSMQRPKNGAYFYTCEKQTLADNSVTFSAVRQLSNMTYASLWCSTYNAAYIDGGHIYANSVTATQIAAGTITGTEIAANTITAGKINLTDLFSQNITATNFSLTGGSINIETSSTTDDLIILSSGIMSAKLSPSTLKLTNSSTSAANRIWQLWTFGLRGYDDNGGIAGFSYQTYVGGTGWGGVNGRYAVNDSSGKERTVLDKDGLTFTNSNSTITASYASTETTAEYTPSDTHSTALTFSSDSRIYVRKWGIGGYIRLEMQLTNGASFGSGQDHVICTLPAAYRPRYNHAILTPSSSGKTSCLIKVLTSGNVVMARYSASAAWGNDWIRAEIPMDYVQ